VPESGIAESETTSHLVVLFIHLFSPGKEGYPRISPWRIVGNAGALQTVGGQTRRDIKGSSAPRTNRETPHLHPLWKCLLTEATDCEMASCLTIRLARVCSSCSTKLGPHHMPQRQRTTPVELLKYDDVLGPVECLNGGEGVHDRG
jgi:hypothetical protein